ncbi:GNAT family N-acetyltransferase [Chloroflexota bacterium]
MKHMSKNGYQLRPATMNDLEITVEMFNQWSSQALGMDKFTLAESAHEWNTPGFDLETDTRLAFKQDGKLSGYYEVWDLNEPHVRLHCWGCIHPQHSGNGLGPQLVKWAEKRACQAVEKAPAEARVVLVGHALSSDESAVRRYQDAGFELIRHSLRMVIHLNGKAFAPVWSENINIRTMDKGQDDIKLVQAVREAFRDHWGYVESPFDDELARWQHLMETHEDFDPSLWFLAMDGPKIAGFSLCYPKIDDDPDMAWVGSLGVRRPWRRRGLALALLNHSFNVLSEFGKNKVGLAVDANSLTGATRLYEKAGMRSDPQWKLSQYEKELRAGKDLSTQDIGN